MTRRPKSRLPPKLADPARERPLAAVKGRAARGAEGRARRRPQYADPGDDVLAVMRRLAARRHRRSLGPPLRDVTMSQAETAMHRVFGWNGDGPRTRHRPRLHDSTASTPRARACSRSRVGAAASRSRPTATRVAARPLPRARATRPPTAGADVVGTQSAPIDGHAPACGGSTTSRWSPTARASSPERRRRRRGVAVRAAASRPRRGRPGLRRGRARAGPRGRRVRRPRRGRARGRRLARPGRPDRAPRPAPPTRRTSRCSTCSTRAFS